MQFNKNPCPSGQVPKPASEVDDMPCANVADCQRKCCGDPRKKPHLGKLHCLYACLICLGFLAVPNRTAITCKNFWDRTGCKAADKSFVNPEVTAATLCVPSDCKNKCCHTRTVRPVPVCR